MVSASTPPATATTVSRADSESYDVTYRIANGTIDRVTDRVTDRIADGAADGFAGRVAFGGVNSIADKDAH